MRRITQEDLRKMYEPAPRTLYDGVHLALSGLPERKEKKVRRKLSIGFILAAALLLSVAAVAVDKWDLFKPLTDSAIPIMPLEGAEKLVETKLGHAENDLVTVTVEQAVYDGQGVTVMARLSPKDTEHCALFNDWLMDAPGDLYEWENLPVEVPEGEQATTGETAVKLINLPEERSLLIDGEPVAIPDSREAAEAEGLPVYAEGGRLYYADLWERLITGRRDGKQIIWFDVNLNPRSDDLDDLTDGMGIDAEEQADGSVLVWFDSFAEAPLPDVIQMMLRATVTLDEDKYPLDDIVFALNKAEDGREVRYAPERDGAIGDRVRVRDVRINLTKVRAYVTIDYEYEAREDEPMGIDFRLYDQAGNRLETGSGSDTFPDNSMGFYRLQMEMQSFDDIPETLTVEAKVIDGKTLGSCVCRLKEADET